MQDRSIDNAIVNPKTYSDEAGFHAILTRLRLESPVHWMEPDGYRPFWIVTKRADVVEVEKQNELFVNAPRGGLQPSDEEERIKDLTGAYAPKHILTHMDDPEHRAYRGLTQDWFMPQNLARFEQRIESLARESIDRMEELGSECDFAQDIAAWYPLRVIMMLLGVPKEHETGLLRLTQEFLACQDMSKRQELEPNRVSLVVARFLGYLNAAFADRRSNARDDLTSLIANGRIGDQPIGNVEAVSYYVTIMIAGSETVSSAASGGLLALINNPDQLALIRANPDLLPRMIDEFFRWVSPITHFFRTATADYVLRGRKISAGSSLLMSYPSANRDEDEFDEPFSFRADRFPNRHVAFGHGPHACLGLHLAKIEMRALFRELLNRIDEINLTGQPQRTESCFLSGLRRLPISYRIKEQGRLTAPR